MRKETRRLNPAGFSLVFAAGGDLLLMRQFSFQHSSARLTQPVD
jgi:hypothetical protein